MPTPHTLAAKNPDHRPAEVAERMPEFREMLRIVVEGRRLILAIGLAGLLLGLVLALMTRPMYRATALLQYDPSANESIEQGRAGSFRPSVANQEMLATQMGLLRSDALARRVAEDLHLDANPRFGGNAASRDDRLKTAAAVLQGGTEVDTVKSSLLIRVSESSADPALAAQITNTLAQDFIALSLERRYNSSSYARRFLNDQLAKTKAALEESDRQLNEYAIQAGLFHTPGQVVDGRSSDGVSLSVSDLNAMEIALNEARVRRIAAQSAWQHGAAADDSRYDTTSTQLEQDKARLQGEYAESGRLFKPDYPKMKELAAQIAGIDAAIAASARRGQNAKTQTLDSAFRAAREAETALAQRVAAAKTAVQGERGSSIRYNILQREADTNRALYDALLQRYKEVGVAGGIGQSTIALVDEASAPKSPYRPRILLNAIIGLIFGLLAGLAAAFARQLLFDTVVDPADVRAKLGLPVLGVIPLESDRDELSTVLTDPKSDVSEAYYSTLTALKFAREAGMARTLFVTSSRPGEGKSTSAYAIAVISARLGRRVLLIDADLRRPTFGQRRDTLGFAHLLGSDEPAAKFIQSSAIDNLSLLPVGAFNGSAAELLSSVRLPAIIREVREHYDLVVLDGPPVLGLTDAPLLTAVSEATIFVIESRKTRTAHIADLAHRIREAGGDILGVILTKLDRGTMRYGYGYGYGYGYSDTNSHAGAGAGASGRFDPGGSLGSAPSES